MNRCGLFLINLGVKGSVPPQETWLFLLSFKLGNSIPSTQTETKLLYKYKHVFFLKTGSLILNWVPLFLLQSIIPERLSSQSTLPNYLVNWEHLEVQSRLMLKKKQQQQQKIIFHLYFWIGKNWEVQAEQHSKITKSLCELRKTWRYGLRSTAENTNFESTGELEKRR